MRRVHLRPVRHPVAPCALLLLAGALLAACACARAPEELEAPHYAALPAPGVREPRRFAVHPQLTPRHLAAVFGPLVARLEQACGEPLRLEASRSYQDFEAKLRARTVDFALPNPYQTVSAEGWGYRPFAKMGDDERFRGLLLAPRGRLRALTDLRGQRIAFPAPTALAAAMMPQLMLAEAGLLPGRDYEAVYVGSQESAISAALGGEVTAASTWPQPWDTYVEEHPAAAQQLEVAFQTPWLVNNSVMARDDVPPALVACMRAELGRLHLDAAGRALLAPMRLSRFEAADEATYAPVRAVLDAFQTRVGPLP